MEVSAQLQAPPALPLRRKHGVHLRGGSMKTGAILDDFKKRKICAVVGIQIHGHPSRNLNTIRIILSMLVDKLEVCIARN
jgi:hypothetical protein